MAVALTQIGSLTQGDVPVLIDVMLQDSSADVRLAAAAALKSMGEEADSALNAYVKALKDHDGRVRLEAMKALTQLGAIAKPAVPSLTKALEEEKNSDVRSEAALALSKVGPDAKEAVPALMEVVRRDPSKEVRLHAIAVFEALGPDGKAGVPVLTERLKEKDRETRERLVAALGAIGPDAKPAIDRLIPLMHDAQLRPAVQDALVKIGKDCVKPLMPLLMDTNSDLRLAAVQTLGSIGTPASPALRLLSVLSKKDVPAIREAAQESIKKILGKTAVDGK
jgi:HEAT repeat protein